MFNKTLNSFFPLNVLSQNFELLDRNLWKLSGSFDLHKNENTEWRKHKAAGLTPPT